MSARTMRGAMLGFGLASLSVRADDVGDLRKELEAMRAEYESRIEALEGRIKELEEQPPPAPPAPPPQPAHSPAAAPNRASPAASLPPPPKVEEPTIDEVPLATREELSELYRSDTETRDLSRSAQAERVLSDRLESVLDDFVDITGYFRSGYGRSDKGGPQRAFGIPGIPKYRLGNEAETYGEIAFRKNFFLPGMFSLDDSAVRQRQSGPSASTTIRLAFFNPYEEFGSGADTDFSVPEVWASLGGIFPSIPEAKVWAGSRFYRRHDIHVNDFYFWDMSGGGIEDVPLGSGKFALAWIGDGAESAVYSQTGFPDPENEAGYSKTNIDARYYDWCLLGGSGEFGITVSHAESGLDVNGNSTDDAWGVAASLVRTNSGFADPESLHKTSLQIGTGPAKTFTAGFDTFTNDDGTFIRPDPEESWRFRATDQYVIKPLERLSIGTAAVYQYTDFGDDLPEQHWASFGLRPIWHFCPNLSLAFEGGADWVSQTQEGDGGWLGKFTLAPQWSLGDQFFSRPVVRAFVTYSIWESSLQGEVGGIDYSDSTDGFSWGVQMESWW